VLPILFHKLVDACCFCSRYLRVIIVLTTFRESIRENVGTVTSYRRKDYEAPFFLSFCHQKLIFDKKCWLCGIAMTVAKCKTNENSRKSRPCSEKISIGNLT